MKFEEAQKSLEDEDSYFKVISSLNQAVISVTGKEIKVLYCSGYELCYYTNVLRSGKCPQYCELIAELKKYLFRGRKPKYKIVKLSSFSEALKNMKVTVDLIC